MPTTDRRLLCLWVLSQLLLVTGCRDTHQLAAKPPFLAASADTIDFGERAIGSDEERTIYLINTGEMPVDLEPIQGDSVNGVFATLVDTQTIPPATDAIVRIVFSPVDVAEYETTYILRNNSINEPTFTLTLKGVGVQPGPCDNVSCLEAPSPSCVASDTSRIFEPNGVCEEGLCVHSYTEELCEFGCDFNTGLCRGSPCEGIVCNEPPSDCYFANGTCVDGACNYTLNNQTQCSDQNPCTLGDTCNEGLCLGTPVVCAEPPPPICVDSSTARTWDAQGVCNTTTGACDYARHDQYCEHGCTNGYCEGDPCADVVCDTPPSPSCYSAEGYCVRGSCIYPTVVGSCDDGNVCTTGDTCNNGTCTGAPVVCNSPPPAQCVTGNATEIFAAQGTCGESGCQYPSNIIQCNDGNACTENDYCENGTCLSGALNDCDDNNPCTTDYCDPAVGCRTQNLSGGSCVSPSSLCPLGTCVAGTCMPVPDVTCTAEVGLDLCLSVDAPGRCSASGECVPTEVPPGYTCPGCNGICIQCIVLQYCIPIE